MRLARLLRFARFAVIVARALQAERQIGSGDALRIAALLTVTIVMIAGAAQAAFVSKDFDSLWDGVWWAITTLTTVGYGDLYPTTVQGRLIGIAVMAMGIAFVSVLTAAIAARFVTTERASETDEMLDTLNRLEGDWREATR